MATETWPADLPQSMQLSLMETHQAGFIRTPMDAGPAKSRKRFTATTRMHTGTMIMDVDQRASFLTFFESTLEMGSLSFYFTDPGDGNRYTWRFVDVPKFTAIASHNDESGRIGLWRVNVAIERLN